MEIHAGECYLTHPLNAFFCTTSWLLKYDWVLTFGIYWPTPVDKLINAWRGQKFIGGFGMYSRRQWEREEKKIKWKSRPQRGSGCVELSGSLGEKFYSFLHLFFRIKLTLLNESFWYPCNKWKQSTHWYLTSIENQHLIVSSTHEPQYIAKSS